MDAKTPGQLVTQLNTMRKKLAEIDDQWETYRSQWASYLDKATQMWVSHVEAFESGEAQFAERRKTAVTNLQTTRAALHDAHMRTMEMDGGEKVDYDMETAKAELDASMTVDEEQTMDTGLDQIKADLTGIVRQVRTTMQDRINKRDRSRSRGAEPAEVEVEILEPAEKKVRDSPKP